MSSSLCPIWSERKKTLLDAGLWICSKTALSPLTEHNMLVFGYAVQGYKAWHMDLVDSFQNH